MNLTLVMVGGLVVAVLIIGWAVLEVIRRYTRQKKAEAQARNAWVMVKPTTTTIVDDASSETHDEHTGDTTNTELHKRAKQNGHYSQSKNPT